MKILLVNHDFDSKGSSGGHFGELENSFGILLPLNLLYPEGSLINGGYTGIELNLSKKENNFYNDMEIEELVNFKEETRLDFYFNSKKGQIFRWKRNILEN